MADALPYYMIGQWRLPTKRLIRVFVSGLDGDLHFACIPVVRGELTAEELSHCETEVFSELLGRLQGFNQDHPGVLSSHLLLSELCIGQKNTPRWEVLFPWRLPSRRETAASRSPEPKRFGELLVDEKVVTPEQLEAALQLQAVSETYVPIGQVLLTNKLVTRKQLTELLRRHKKRSQLGRILLQARCITTTELKEALKHQQRTHAQLGQILMDLGYLSEATMRDALCTQLHINFFDLDPIWIDPCLAGLISERFATRHQIVPLFRIDDILVLAMDDPSNTALIEDLQLTLNVNIEVVTAMKDTLKAAQHRLYKSPVTRHVDAARRRDILIGPVRDHVVAQLAAAYLLALCRQ